MAKYYTKISDEDGNEFLLAVNITGHGAPTEDTEAEPGMCYLDEDSEHGDLYKCIGVLVTETRTVYRWKKLAGQEEVERLEKAIGDLSNPSWNDLTDKPFYAETVEVVLLEETELVFNDGGAGLPTPIELIEGQTYNVTYNGNVYSCVAWLWEIENIVFIGNGGFLGENTGNGEPFFSNGYFIGSDDQSATVKIVGSDTVIHHLDPKYIKDMYGEVPGDWVNVEFTDPIKQGISTTMFVVQTDTWSANTVPTLRVDGVEYAFDGMTNKGVNNIMGGTVYYIGAEWFPFNSSMNFGEYPFSFATVDFTNIYAVFEDGTPLHTVEIYAPGLGVQIRTIDEKYLPESIKAKLAEYSYEIEDIKEKSDSHMNDYSPVCTGSFSMNRKNDTTVGASSVALGYHTEASGERSYAEGSAVISSGFASHAEGAGTTASGLGSHAEGNGTTASGDNSHAEGYLTTASGSGSHAEGYNTTASGDYSHAEGYFTTASGLGSHAEGNDTTASGECQHVQGKYNIDDPSGTYQHIVGNGTASIPSNAHTLDWEGNAWFAGTVEGKALILPSSTEGSTKRFKITVDDSGTISATEITT